MRKITLVVILTMAAWLTVPAQAQQFMRGNCMPDSETADSDGPAAKRVARHLRTPNTEWDAERTYPVAVVLVEASDTTFTIENPQSFYNRLFNENGFNERNGKGCVADYFRDQSDGLFNLEFHIYGPMKVSFSMRDSGKYGEVAFKEALQMVIDANPDVDYSQYDWDGNGSVEQVIFVYAGFGGNETNSRAKGCIWPNTSSFGTVMAPGGVEISRYTASAELWAANNQSCGIGTVCHEFSHSLGLPDIYPTNGSSYSVVDEWDLMDGGNFTDRGWCPPNYTALEKMLMGWLTPTELTEPASIENLKPVEAGGKAYVVRTDGNTDEFFLIENRQWSGWDSRAPGHGLLICHVDYLKSAWSSNTVNISKIHRRFEYFAADNRNYDAWDDYLEEIGSGGYSAGHNLHLSATPYPYQTDDFLNDALTDSSVPAAVTFCEPGLMSKPITHIVENADGTVSFDFCGGTSSVVPIHSLPVATSQPCYNLQGQRVAQPPRGLFIRDGKKLFLK